MQEANIMPCTLSSPMHPRTSQKHLSAGWMYLSGKRAFDITFSLLALILFLPLMLFICLWIYLDSRRPILYQQTRVGKNGRRFQMLKFRTMIASAEDNSGPMWALQDDDRITHVGRILRKLYLDELPQLFNIFRGDMSFVGPRPERPFFYPQCEEAVPGFSARCLVRPGLTGLAQSRQSHSASIWAVRRKFRYDIFYIRHQSFLLDMWIIWHTFFLLLRELRDIAE